MLNILSVIVLYKTNFLQSKTYRSLLCNESIAIYIYDNSPEAQEIDQELSNRIIYIHNPLNPGLSFAYNKAAEFASNNGFEWVLLLDQDTSFPENIFSEYKFEINNNPKIKLFVPKIKVLNEKYISPTQVKNHIGKLSNTAPSGITSLWEYMPINSGMMINVDAFLSVGGYNENVKLDYSDYQFIEKFRQQFNSFFILQSVCFQEFSNEVQSTVQLLDRYKIFCNCIRNCKRNNTYDKYLYLWIVLKRGMSLTTRTGNLNFIRILFKYYL